jgi:hypothetical protein
VKQTKTMYERDAIMIVAVHHMIKNPEKWEQSVKHIMALAEQGRLPQGLKGLMFLPGMDGHRADCVWEANSMESLKSFLDGENGSAAKNEYFQVDDASAFGLPAHSELHHAA